MKLKYIFWRTDTFYRGADLLIWARCCQPSQCLPALHVHSTHIYAIVQYTCRTNRNRFVPSVCVVTLTNEQAQNTTLFPFVFIPHRIVHFNRLSHLLGTVIDN